MPLEKGPGKNKFEHNLKEELSLNKPRNQALAIAYSEARQIKQKSPKNLSKPMKKSGRGR